MTTIITHVSGGKEKQAAIVTDNIVEGVIGGINIRFKNVEVLGRGHKTLLSKSAELNTQARNLPMNNVVGPDNRGPVSLGRGYYAHYESPEGNPNDLYTVKVPTISRRSRR